MPIILGIIAFLFLLGFIKNNPGPALLMFIVVVIVSIFVHMAGTRRREDEAKRLAEEFDALQQRLQEYKDEADAAIEALIQKHLKTLSLKRDQTLTEDDYGNPIFDRWIQEMGYFIKNVLMTDGLIADYLSGTMPSIDGVTSEPEAAEIRKRSTMQLIMKTVTDYKIAQIESGEHLSVDVDALDPIQYEHHCADLLRNSGWDARVTQASGDQGIDVIANYGNIKAVFQCKKYSQAVGNAAVQEIIAGKQFEQAHIAAVVTNAAFTQSAKQLANATGVFLLHHDELPGFAAQVGLIESAA